jgi:LPXTG-motif cell wall-anchored protein
MANNTSNPNRDVNSNTGSDNNMAMIIGFIIVAIIAIGIYFYINTNRITPTNEPTTASTPAPQSAGQR